MDIVEIALDTLTDNVAFEALAAEVMRDEGYPDIKPLGGVADLGRDAMADRYYVDGERHITVFQFTLEKYLTTKLKDTVEKLAENKVEYNELVIVTPARISTDLQEKLIKCARKDYRVSLKIAERKTLLNRLSNYATGIFHRYFPDIERQVIDLVASRSRQNVPPTKARESEMLRVSTVFSFSKEGHRVRKSVFDNVVLSLILSTEGGTTLEAVAAAFQDELGIPRPPIEQIRASVDRLVEQDLVVVTEGTLTVTREAVGAVEGGNIRAHELTEALISDLVEEVASASDRKLSKVEIGRLRQNARSVLVELFRLFGLELANQVIKREERSAIYFESTENLMRTAKAGLNETLGEMLVAGLGEMLTRPTAEQAEVLEAWALAYLGVSIMNLDPTLGEFQTTRLKGKVFLVDTDVVLEACILETPTSQPLRTLLEALVRLGCRVVITEECVRECVDHAAISPRTCNYFGDSLLSLDEASVREHVNNVFVQGYYHARSSGLIRPNISFVSYLSNYYEARGALGFFTDVLRDNLPDGVEILPVAELLNNPLPEAEVVRVSAALFERMLRSPKAQYRTEEDMRSIAHNDSVLFLTALQLNSQVAERGGSALEGKSYIITNAGRYIRAARAAGLTDFVTTRPQILVGLLEIVGQTAVAPEAFVKLFENPFLIHAVEQSWDDIEGLVRAGVELHGKSLVRLKWDLDQVLHESISALTAVDLPEGENEDESPPAHAAAPEADDNEYVSLLKSAARRGYRIIPEAKALVETIEKSQKKADDQALANAELMARYEKLEEAIAGFSKKRQRYLRRVARQQGRTP